MVIDDHDISDDWNISRSWKQEMDRKPWWHRRVRAGFMTYWIYQHLGNLSPRELSEDETLAKVKELRDDAGPVLRDYADRAYDDREGIRWSYHRDLCGTRVIVMDSRGGRVLEEGRRSILDDEEREWVGGQADGNFDHLLIATSDPFLLSHGIHYLEAWQRGGVRRDLGEAGGEVDGETAPRHGLRSLGRVRDLVSSPHGAAPRGRGRREGGRAGDDRGPLRRRPPRLSGGDGVPAGERRHQPRLPGGLLAVSEPARREGAAGDQDLISEKP